MTCYRWPRQAVLAVVKVLVSRLAAANRRIGELEREVRALREERRC